MKRTPGIVFRISMKIMREGLVRTKPRAKQRQFLISIHDCFTKISSNLKCFKDLAQT